MNDEHFYTMVAEELRTVGPIAGLWAKAFAESEGNEPRAKALYLRYRVEQLAMAETSAIRARQEAIEDEKTAELKRAEVERGERAKAEGFTWMHGVFVGLALFIIAFSIYRGLCHC